MNFLKSFWGGLGSKPMQEQRESSSEPNPLYGGICLPTFGGGGALYGTGIKSSVNTIHNHHFALSSQICSECSASQYTYAFLSTETKLLSPLTEVSFRKANISSKQESPILKTFFKFLSSGSKLLLIFSSAFYQLLSVDGKNSNVSLSLGRLPRCKVLIILAIGPSLFFQQLNFQSLLFSQIQPWYLLTDLNSFLKYNKLINMTPVNNLQLMWSFSPLFTDSWVKQKHLGLSQFSYTEFSWFTLVHFN